MNIIHKFQKLSLYFFFFTINFETLDLFDLKVDFLATKISFTVLIISSFFSFRELYKIKHYKLFFYPIILLFLIFIINSFLHRNSEFNNYFDVPFFINLVILILMCNFSLRDKNIIIKGLYIYSIVTCFISVLYILNIGVIQQYEGRSTIFGMNENDLGLKCCISLFILLPILVTNIFKWSNNRFLLVILIPFLFITMIKTGSRVAFISFIIDLVLLLYYNKSINRKNKFVITYFVLIFSFFIWFIALKNSVVIGRLTSSISQGDLSSRDLIWISIFGIISNNYLLGIGKTGYSQQISPFFGGVTSPHNVLIETVCYSGLIGLVIFTIFLFKVFKIAVKKNKEEYNIVPILLGVPLVGMLLSGQLYEVKIGWIIIAYMVSFSNGKEYSS